MKYKSVIISIALLAAASTASAQTTGTASGSAIGHDPHTTVKRERVLPLVTTKIKLLTRAYGDSIVLRWAAEDYVSWKYLADFGVNVLRVPKDEQRGLHIDTLAYGLKPLTQEQWQAKYPRTDSLALVPQGVLYGEAENRHQEKEGTMGRTLEDNSNQDLSYGFAMLVAEWRKDIATDMAVRLVDRTAEAGKTYDYYVQPTVWENDGRLIFEPGVVEDVKNEPYTPMAYTPRMVDSLSTPHTLTIGWWDAEHSSFEIDRRQVSDLMGRSRETDWQRVNTKPYVSMVEQPEGEDYCLFGDSVPELGVWEYRIRAYDTFGDLTEPSPTRRIVVRDVQPPTAPNLKYIVLERPEEDPMSKVIANIVWEKPVQENDLAGYRIYYNPMRGEGEAWRPLNIDLIPPTDTLYRANVTGMRTGMIYIAAFDDSGNEAHSFIQQLRLQDYKAPDPPQNLRATIMPIDLDSLQKSKDLKVEIALTWSPSPDDDIAYYDLSAANDSTHEFINVNKMGIRENLYNDTLVLDVNQKYIYYRVRAIDFSSNIGLWSRWIEVERPHLSPPTQPHIYRSSQDDKTGIHLEWVVGDDADMKYHSLYRRAGEGDKWERIGRYSADSLRAHDNMIIVDDNPPYLQTERYYYFVESTNASPFKSQSLAVSFRHRGPRTIDVPIKLGGVYYERTGETRLAWEADTKNLPEGRKYFCIYRKGPGEDKFTYQRNVEIDERMYSDYLMRPAEQEQQAEYYILVQFADGRSSQNSNVATVKAPAKK